MRVESVTAHAFGPLHGQILELAPGMTVIAGRNESAKSSWHAALLAGMCGRRRGKGAGTIEDRHFAERHKPWDEAGWRVSVVVELDSGQRVELTHDLEGRVDCRAVDLATGRDLSSEIMFEGAPDGSRWLGLDRKSFAATASINQADLLGVLDVADGLQEHLQRAASTAGTDATAAAALERIAAFRRDHVGLDRVNSTKPLRAAKDQLEAASDALTTVLSDHEGYLALLEGVEVARNEGLTSAEELRGAEERTARLERALGAYREWEAAQANRDRDAERAAEPVDELRREQRRLGRAIELDDVFGGAPPQGVAESEEVAAAVAAALAGWAAAVQPVELDGESAESLRAKLAVLPGPSAGDTDVDPGVQRAATQLDQATAIRIAHEEKRPADSHDGSATSGDLAAAVEASPAVVRGLAAQFSSPVHSDSSGIGEVQRLSDALALARERSVMLDGELETLESAYRAAQAAEHQADADAARAAVELEAATQAAEAHAKDGAASRRRRHLFAALSGGLAVVGAVLLGIHLVVPGAILITAAAGSAIAALLARTSGPDAVAAPHMTPSATSTPVDVARAATARKLDELEAARTAASSAQRNAALAEGQWASAQASAASVEQATVDLRAKCEARGLPADPTRLTILAAEAEHYLEQRDIVARWAAELEHHVSDEQHAESRLREALAAKGLPAESDTSLPFSDLFEQYKRDCSRRADQDRESARRPSLEQAAAARETLEQAHRSALERRSTAARELSRVRLLIRADEAGLCDAHPEEELASHPDEVGESTAEQYEIELKSWQVTHAEQARESEARAHQWSELQTLLDGCSLDDLRHLVEELEGRIKALDEAVIGRQGAVEAADVQRLTAAEDAGIDVAQNPGVVDVEGLVAVARADVAEVRKAATLASGAMEQAEGVLRERSRNLASVAEAEEAVAEARVEVQRVDELSDTLAKTAAFLTVAQDEVHRSIAPILAETLRAWLPGVTDGRYVDALVDPASLAVKVCGPERQWRQANRLSVGTAEQVYLLLRVALAQHLVTTTESCPLFLDDVTVQADPVRTGEILSLLLQLSADRQIVLFAQEPAVSDWARENLTGERHALRELPQVATT